MKQCTKCKKWKSFTAFYKLKTGKDGLHSWCIVCDRKAGKKYEQTHRIEINKRRKKYRKTVIGCLRNRFQRIKQRCNNPKNARYKDYGGRGIQCLFESANEFIDYVVNELRIDPHGLTIDRIDNDGHYEKGNIRFVTAKINCNNRRKRNN